MLRLLEEEAASVFTSVDDAGEERPFLLFRPSAVRRAAVAPWPTGPVLATRTLAERDTPSVLIAAVVLVAVSSPPSTGRL